MRHSIDFKQFAQRHAINLERRISGYFSNELPIGRHVGGEQGAAQMGHILSSVPGTLRRYRPLLRSYCGYLRQRRKFCSGGIPATRHWSAQSRHVTEDPEYAATVLRYAQRMLSLRMEHMDQTLTGLVVTSAGLLDGRRSA